MQLAFLAILCAAAWDNRSADAWRLPGLTEALGLGVILVGVHLRRSAAQALGRHFTVRLSLLDDHQLVSTGPYRWIRHPNYTGLALVAFGTALMVRSPVAAAVAASVWLPVALFRIRDEERALSERFGAAYAEYSRGAGAWCAGSIERAASSAVSAERRRHRHASPLSHTPRAD